MTRFSACANTPADAAAYAAERAIQALKHGVHCDALACVDGEGQPSPQSHACAVVGWSTAWDRRWVSIYLLDHARGAGRFCRIAAALGLPLLTHEDCAMTEFFRAKQFEFHCLEETPAYRQVGQFYGDRKAGRSGVWYMRHVDEGLAVLRYFYAGAPHQHAADGFCYHPLVQSDADLMTTWQNFDTTPLPARGLLVAMEYRAVANAALSDRDITSADAINLSPLAEVNAMLVADKVQNRKDFELYHHGHHPRSAALDRYFRLWLDRLGITEATYQAWRAQLDHPRQQLAAFLGELDDAAPTA